MTDATHVNGATPAPRRRRPLVTLAATACLALFGLTAPGAQASLDIRTVNTGEPGAQFLPAFYGVGTAPAGRALWAGTCDLTSAGTANGGVGAAGGGIEPPAVRAHCIDVGLNYGNAVAPWEPGKEPRWRLDPVTQAGAHPDASAAFWFKERALGGLDGTVKNIVVKLPPGVVGSPTATPQCSALLLQSVPTQCPANTQVGLNTIGFSEGAGGGALVGAQYKGGLQSYGVYNVEARDTVTAEFSINGVSGLFNIPIIARGRTNSDYGVDTLALLIPEFATFMGQAFTFWGVPWAAEHDKFRIEAKDQKNGAWGINEAGYEAAGHAPTVAYDPSWGPIKPFFTNPTECRSEPDPVIVELDSYQNPVSAGGDWIVNTTFAPPITGCEQLEFDPAITLQPDIRVADSPNGLNVLLTTPQNNDPPSEALGNPNLATDPSDATGAPAYWRSAAGLGSAHLKDTTVRLPAGTSFNPAAANGLRGCGTEEIGLTALEPKVTFNNDAHRCPDSSKIGTLEIVSPLLPDPLVGEVFVAPQHDNPFPGSLTAIYMVAQDEERGLSVKLPGKVDLDERTGQIATTFVDNPQLPFDSFELHFETGPRAPLNTPAVCGQFENSVDLTPWSHPHSGPLVNIRDPFPISAMPNGLPCVTEPEDRVFSPGFEAGSSSLQAGGETTFVLDVTRQDGNQEVSGVELKMPEGLVAKLAHTPYCPDATLAAIEGPRSGKDEAAASLCPVASRIGEVRSLAGAGPLPLPTDGKLYLAGPYAGAPLSIVAIVPAIAGGEPGEPAFDLGNVVVRSGAFVDPRTAQVTVSSSRLPYIVGGVPLRVRRLTATVDKPDFMRNPTSCEPTGVAGRLGGAADPLDGVDDTAVDVSSPFQVGNCEALKFKPRLSLRLFGGIKRAKYQGLRAVLRARPGDANIGRAAVTMPRSAFLAQEHLENICTRVQFAADACPKRSVYGRATATSPLLDYPLSGNVYLRSSDNLLPDLVADLRGPAHQPIRIELVGRTDSVKGALRNTFDVAPDAPVSKFVLQLFGGGKGLIVNSRNICSTKNRAKVNLLAHNGRRSLTRPVVRNKRCKRFAKRNKRRAGHRRKGAGRKGAGQRARARGHAQR